jgi:imidazolonepropionase
MNKKMTAEKVKADFVIHDLASAVLFPAQYRGQNTPVGWNTEEFKDCSIAAFDGRIVWIGKADELENHVSVGAGTRFLNGNGLLATPGFVDSHTHLVYAGDRSDEFEMRVQGRSYLDILAAGGGILRTTGAIRDLSEEAIFAESAALSKWPWKAALLP